VTPTRRRFIACTACARHVREGDATCPFCGAVAPALRPLLSLSRRLSRAALHAAAAAGAVAALNDCGGSTATEPPYGLACGEMGEAPCAVADGGRDAGTDAKADATYDAGNDAGGGEVFYGGPCPGGGCYDSGPSPEASTEAGDAEVTDGPTDAGSAGGG
jgi:hypothetical protein